MSATPQNLPKRTRVLSKDLLFQEKHLLSNTQVDLMSYIFNAFTWTMKIEGHMVLTNKKFANDLPQISEKTLETSLKELENKGLIERNLVKVPSWNNARVRGIKITMAGMGYNSSLYTPSHEAIVYAFQERVNELEFELAKKENEPREDNETTETQVEENRENQEDERESTEDERISVVTLEEFIYKTRKQFLLSSQPICNMVDGWQKESTFYINSYGKLSLSTKDMDFKQLNNPIEINKFWQWLFTHQERVGKVLEVKQAKDNLLKLQRKYRDKEVKINGKTRWIADIVPMKHGLSIKIKDKYGQTAILSNSAKEPLIYGYDALEHFVGCVCNAP